MASNGQRFVIDLQDVAPVEPPHLKPGKSVIRALWFKPRRSWLLRRPGGGWTMFPGVWSGQERPADLMQVIRQREGAQATAGLHVEVVEEP